MVHLLLLHLTSKSLQLRMVRLCFLLSFFILVLALSLNADYLGIGASISQLVPSHPGYKLSGATSAEPLPSHLLPFDKGESTRVSSISTDFLLKMLPCLPPLRFFQVSLQAT